MRRGLDKELNSLQLGRVRRQIQWYEAKTSGAFARMKRISVDRYRMLRDFCDCAPRGLRLLRVMGVICLAAFVVIISSCGGKNGAGTITVEINPGNAQTVDEAQMLMFTATVANDTSNKGVTWMLTGTGCSGTGCGTLSSTTAATITYTAPTPVSVGFSVTLTATSVAATAALKTVTISVVVPPVFTTTTLPNGQNGVQYFQTIVVTGGVSPLTFSLAAGSGSLPAGLTLNTTGSIVGTPSGSGTSNFTVQVKDNDGLAVTQALSIAINPAPPLSIATTSLPPATVNVPYTGSVVAIGGVNPLTWSVTPNLPAGLTLNQASGVISGTPTTATSATTFTFSVHDSALPANQTATVQLSLSVNPAQPLQISTLSLASGTTAKAYTAPVAVSGGVQPYTFTLASGQLPAGLTIGAGGVGGQISGTPIIAGASGTSQTSTFTIEVTDSEKPVANVAISIPLSITIAAGANNLPLFNGSYTFLFNGFDSQGSVAVAGAFTASSTGASGTISGGVQDSNRVSGVVLAATLTGSFTIGSDGRGTLSLTATNSTGGILTTDYELVLESDGSARMIENDTTCTQNVSTCMQGTGIIKPQPSTSLTAGSFSGNYAFGFSGQDLAGKPTAFAGTVFADGVGTFNRGEADFNDAGTIGPALPLNGTFSLSGSFGRGSATIVFQLPKQEQVTLTYVFYFVSPGAVSTVTDLFFVAVDVTDSTHPRLDGEMLAQTNTAFNLTTLPASNAGVATGSGANANSDVFAGLLQGDGNGNATLTFDENNGGAITGGATSASLAGTYVVFPNGRVSFSGLGQHVSVAYLTGANQGFLIGTDSGATLGLLEEQTGGPVFSTASILDGYTLSAPVATDNQVLNIIGQFFADGAGSLTGILDEAGPNGTGNPGQVVATDYTVANNGRGTILLGGLPGLPTNLVLYVVSHAKFRAVSVTAGDAHPEVIFFDH